MTMRTELAVVGGGPAGLAVAIEAARRGVQVTLVDCGGEPGGALALQTHAYDGVGLYGFAIGALLWQAAAAGATLLPRTLVWGLFEDRTLGLAINHGTDAERSDLLQAEIVLIATGAVDRFTPFPGATLPGVLTATAALTLFHRWRVRPGMHALIVGSDPIAARVEQAVREAGMQPTHVPSADGLHALAGADRTLATVEKRGESAAPAWTREQDTLILAEGMQPANELTRMVDCAMVWSAALGGHVPRHDAKMQTSVPGVFVAGDAAGVGDVGSAMLHGRVAAAAIADRLGKKKLAFGAFPVTITAGAFRPIHAAIWQSVRVTEAAR